MTDLAMRKRPAARAGEIGLFVDATPFEDDFSNIKMNAEVLVKATTPRSFRQHKFAWALATKISEACDWLDTKDDAMEYLLIEAKHFRRIYDPLRKIAHLIPKPTNWSAMDGADYTRLLKRMTYVAITQIVPGLEDTVLRAEIEAMIGPDTAPEPPKPRRKNLPANKGAQGDKVKRKEVQTDTSSASNGDGAPTGSLPNRGRSESATEETR